MVRPLMNEIKIERSTWSKNKLGALFLSVRYIGDALFQKYYTTEMLPFILRRNQGQKAKYYVKGTNQPIISKEVFEAAQRLLNSTQSTYHGPRNPKTFSGMMRCRCGAIYAPMFENHYQAFSHQICGHISPRCVDCSKLQCGFSYYGIQGCRYQLDGSCEGYVDKNSNLLTLCLDGRQNVIEGCMFEAFLSILGISIKDLDISDMSKRIDPAVIK